MDILYLPVSGPQGSGEAQAALLLARAMQREMPQLKQCIALSRLSVLANATDVNIHYLNTSPTRDGAAVNALLQALRPRVVIFDSTSRAAQLKAAKAVGAKLIFMCWRATSRRRALALRKLGLWDQFWLLFPLTLEPPLGAWESLKLRWAPFQLSILGPFADAPNIDAARGLLPPGFARFVLVTPSGQYGVEQFRAISEALVARGVNVVLSVSAPPRLPSQPGLLELDRLDNATLLGLLSLSERCLINGGSLLLQALALGLKPLAMPMVPDQPGRIAKLQKLDLCDRAEPSASAGVLAAQLLAQPLVDRVQQQTAANTAQIRNGLPEAVRRLRELLGADS